MQKKPILSLFIICFFSITLVSQNSKYFVSKIYPKGEFELNIFNNYYSQKDFTDGSAEFDSRTNFYTSSTQFLYGIGHRFNVGLNLRFRSVNQNLQELSPYFEALKFKNEGYFENDLGRVGYSRIGLTSIGATIKYQPFKSFSNISFQHSLFVPTGSDLGGNDETGWIDWDNPSLFNQFFYDNMIGDNFSFFAEFSMIIENISGALFSKSSGFYQFSTPITLILNYYLDDISTLYLLANAAPRWEYSVNQDLQKQGVAVPFNQFGIGYKMYVNSSIQLEVLYTAFYSSVPGRTASTINFGFRYFGSK